jgi:hypothetical protein
MQVTAQSGNRTNISLASSFGAILAVSNSSKKGTTAVIRDSSGNTLISYLSR